MQQLMNPILLVIIHGVMKNELYSYQKEALNRLKPGSILDGGVGSGKSKVALAFYYKVICKGSLETDKEGLSDMKEPRDLYIITTAKKRDTLEWEQECSDFRLSNDRSISMSGVKVVIDSWNNIKKYVNIKEAFFIFDEQRLVGYGVWVKTFLKISKSNLWILLTATPGDTWMDYIPVFIANGFYRTKTEFIRAHVVYNSFVRFPVVDRYVNTDRLARLKKEITVHLDYQNTTKSHYINVPVEYDENKLKTVTVNRWDIYKDKPIKQITSFIYVLRRIVNEHSSRIEAVRKILDIHNKVIVFYNFNYELDILRTLEVHKAEYNGHKHQPIPDTENWVYLVQYTSGAEGWNCIKTNAIIFYSLNYSYRIMTQAAGRINRLNTPFKDLYYYRLKSDSHIDRAIENTLKRKRNFNERSFIHYLERRNDVEK